MHGATVQGQRSQGGNSQPIDVQLPAPAFFAPWSDFVVEHLPHREHVVYRVHLWQPGAPTTQVHLYQMRGREDVEVFGKTYKQAWVLEDRNADGSQLLGRMWLIDGPPSLVRWSI